MNPYNEDMVTVKLVPDPRVTVLEGGVAVSVKSGTAAVTTSVIVVEWIRLPLVPVIVSG